MILLCHDCRLRNIISVFRKWYCSAMQPSTISFYYWRGRSVVPNFIFQTWYNSAKAEKYHFCFSEMILLGHGRVISILLPEVVWAPPLLLQREALQKQPTGPTGLTSSDNNFVYWRGWSVVSIIFSKIILFGQGREKSFSILPSNIIFEKWKKYNLILLGHGRAMSISKNKIDIQYCSATDERYWISDIIFKNDIPRRPWPSSINFEKWKRIKFDIARPRPSNTQYQK